MNNWPKYYNSELITNKGTIAIVCGWTKKETIYEKLSKKNKEKVAVIGQLYSKQGINFVIRNTFLNPNINFLIVTGKDLSGSLKEFKELLNKEKKDFLHKEIKEEKINEFVNYFNKYSLSVEEDNINSAIENLTNLPRKWTQEPILFKDHIAQKASTFHSEKVAFRIEGRKVSKVWLKVLDRILKFGTEKKSAYGGKQKELINIITVVSSENPDNPHLPSFLNFNKDHLLNYYPQMMTGCVFEGVEYTYGSRLRNHNGINQIKNIIEDLKTEHYSRRGIAFTWNVEKDTKNKNPPCLNLVQALVQNNTLYLTAYFRSNDMFKAWPQNAFGLLKIQKEIATALNLEIGKLVVISCSAHIYEQDLLEAEKIIKEHKPKLECQTDPRGNFVIEISEGNIVVKHIDDNGNFLQEFKGKKVEEIRNQINPFVSDITHAIYLGTELHKAELALRNKTNYTQDKD
ncbi:MAG: thymidylate synthase [Candidatus Pacebacteria bacterium]|nr:thymidylate synthase [Candidatus Paceibacterota bacterium]